MEQHYYLFFCWILGAWFAYSTITKVVQQYRDAARARELGCKPARKLPNNFPFGLEHVRRTLIADRTKHFPDYAWERYVGMGKRTHQHNILGETNYMTADPKNVQAILATQFKDFAIGHIRRNNFLPMFGNGIFTTDFKLWEHSRALMRPQFAREQVSDLELEEEHLQNMMRALPINGSGWTLQVDLQVLFFRLTLDSACEFLFGESVNSQLDNLPQYTDFPTTSRHRPAHALQEKNFVSAFDNGQSWLALRSRVFHLYWLFDSPGFRRSIKDVHSFVDHFVAIALAKNQQQSQGEKSGAPPTPPKNKKGRYVFLDALAAECRDPVELRSQLLNILLAGRDTTASFLGWIFYILARRPDVFSKLRATIIQDFGPYAPNNGAPASISFSKLKNCTYLQHVLKETLRLYPVVPVNSRRAVVDTSIPRGGGEDGNSPIFIKKGQGVDYSVHVMHRLEEYWGEDANEFRPERWIGRRPGWEYLPFNGGPRICLGQQFALTEASYVTVRLLQRFDAIQNCDPATETTHNLSLINSPGEGVKVRLHAAAHPTATG